ncbi:MAG TPA: hypothetical protein VK658_09650 [Chryseolinea sp.]|nr:hypothetical protein [Chryseolinea sp.]
MLFLRLLLQWELVIALVVKLVIMAMPNTVDVENHIKLQKYNGISGLIFDVVGVVFLWIDSQIMGESISKYLNQLMTKSGMYVNAVSFQNQWDGFKEHLVR